MLLTFALPGSPASIASMRRKVAGVEGEEGVVWGPGVEPPRLLLPDPPSQPVAEAGRCTYHSKVRVWKRNIVRM